MSEPAAKKLKTEGYVLYYWPGLPGRGEYIRLAFEFSGTPYTEYQDPTTLIPTITSSEKTSSHPPHFAPPALKLPSGRFISQTAAVLDYVGAKFGLVGDAEGEEGEKEEDRSVVNQLVLSVMDLTTEVHDTHHPTAVEKTYEDQREAAKGRSASFRANRLPKYFKHFQNVLASNPQKEVKENHGGTYLVGSKTTTADLALFHAIEGVTFAFPKRVAALKATGEYDNVFALRDRVANEKGIKEYIASGRRQGFSNGIFRHYEELDGDE